MSYDQEKPFGVDKELLEEFEVELAEEEQSVRKKRKYIIVGGVGALFVLMIIFMGAGDPEVEQSPVKTAPEPVAKIKEPVKIKAPVEIKEPVKEAKSVQVAMLSEENLIGVDFNAPGLVPAEKPANVDAPDPAIENSVVEPGDAPLQQAKINEPDGSAPSVDIRIIQSSGVSYGEITDKAQPAPGISSDTPIILREMKPDVAYSVSVMATADAVRALEVRDNILARGFHAWIYTGKAKKDFYRVESGKFNSIRAASGMSRDLARAGFRARPAYIKGDSRVTLEIGVFENRSKAIYLDRRLSSAGFPSRVQIDRDPIDMYHVRVGKYDSYTIADRVSTKLGHIGYRVLGIVESDQ